MPKWGLRMPPDDELYRDVLSIYGLTEDTVFDAELRQATLPDDLSARIARLRPYLRAMYKVADWPRFIPRTWCHRSALRLLRHVLRSRDIMLRSRVQRVDGVCTRVHYCEPKDARVTVNFIATRTVTPLDIGI